MPLPGNKFTWFGPSNKKSRLDRVVFNSQWPLGKNWNISSECRKSSDHTPLLLGKKLIDWGTIPYKAFNFWLENEDFNRWINKSMEVYESCTN